MKNINKIIKKIVQDFNYKIKISLFDITKKIKISLFDITKKIKISLLNNYRRKNSLFKYKNKSNISTFNKSIITFIVLLFVYLFYLTIPNLYGKTWIQNKIEDKLLSEFKMNFSLSSEISYQILPSPNFTIKNVEILDNSNNNLNTFASIKTLKVFISQKNLFNQEKLKIKKVLINEANFLIDKENFHFFSKFLNKIFSYKIIKIKKSNLFFKDEDGETLLINKIHKLLLFFDKKYFLNTIELKGEALNIPYILKFTKDLVNKKNTTVAKLDKIKINYENQSNSVDKNIKGINTISFLNSKLRTEYKFGNEVLLFQSLNSKLPNNKINYKGELNLDPFDLILNIDLEKINLKKMLDNDSILLSFINSELLFNNNISSNISLNSKYVSNNKIFKNLKVNFNIQNGNIIFDNSQFLIDKIGLLTLTNGKLSKKKDDIIFNGDFNLNLDNSDKFFSYLQTPKNKRKSIKNIYFNIKFDILNNRLYLNNFKIDNLKRNKKIDNILNNFNLNKGKIENSIVFKNLINKIISSYLG